VIGSRRIGV